MAYAKHMAEQFYLLRSESDPTQFRYQREHFTAVEIGAFSTFAHLKLFARSNDAEREKKVNNLLTTTVKRMANRDYTFVPWNEDMPKTQEHRENNPKNRDSSAGSDVSDFSENMSQSSQSQSQSTFSQRTTSRMPTASSQSQSSQPKDESSMTINQDKENAIAYIESLNVIERAQFVKDHFAAEVCQMETFKLSFVSKYYCIFF